MVLDCFDAEETPFGEATLADFRGRLVAAGMAPELLRRTVELARETGGFGYKPAVGLRVAVDSVPLDGAGKIEDTVNLIGRALRLLMQAVAAFFLLSPQEVAARSAPPVLLAPSIKEGLDLDWQSPSATEAAVRILGEHIERLLGWMEKRAQHGVSTLEIEAARERLNRLVAQDTEVDASGARVIRRGVAADRQISISDLEMRHGRKSETERIDGYKQYVARDLDNDLTLASCVLPADVSEARGADKLRPQVIAHGEVSELLVDRAFLSSGWVADLARARLDAVICRPLVAHNGGLFTKQDFTIDLTAGTVRCPGGHLAVIQSEKVHFATPTCRGCPQRVRCQKPDAKKGRAISMSPNETLLQHLPTQSKTAAGRRKLLERVPVEHALTHQRNRHGGFARYRGVAKNDFDAQRLAAVNNLQAVDRRLRRADVEVIDEAA
ncbi:MAG: transposase [Polyangiales bacterium]